MSDKKTFVVEKIKTDQICGLDGGPVSICGLEDVDSIINLSGSNISGQNLFISGSGDSAIIMKSGTFEELYVNGVQYVPRQQIAYAFRFGGPPISVPNELPYVTGGSLSGGYTGLASGTNQIFVEDSSSFQTGDHVIVGGLYAENENQETHTITGISYYEPEHCCNAKVFADRTAGHNRVYYHEEQQTILLNDVVSIDNHSNTYTVTASYAGGVDEKYIEVDPALSDSVLSGTCVCLLKPTLLTESNLSGDFVTGTQVANRFAVNVTGSGCDSGCYNSSHLYLEKAMFANQIFDWNLTGYRESFVSFSGIEFNVTGDGTSGLLTMIYPDI